MEKVVERFIRYAKEYTTSDPESKTYPSTDRQLVFMRKLVDELKEIGLSDGLIRFSIGLDNNIEKTYQMMKGCMKELSIL